MRRAVLLLALAGAACAAAAAPAGATNECKGLQVCVPVAGPWVVTPAAESVDFQLDCPPRYIVGGLDAELSRQPIDVAFAGGLGSPVNPGITTTGSAVFTARFVGHGAVATFRPHIGCIPAAGGGRRTPTSLRVFRPGNPTKRVVKKLAVTLGTHRLSATCGKGRRLVRATYATGFFTPAPPPAAMVAGVHVTQQVHGDRVVITAHASDVISGPPPIPTVVQLDLTCAVAA